MQQAYTAEATDIRADLVAVLRETFRQTSADNVNPNFLPPGGASDPQWPTVDKPYIWLWERNYSTDEDEATAWEPKEVIDRRSNYIPTFDQASFLRYMTAGTTLEVEMPEANYGKDADHLLYGLEEIPADLGADIRLGGADGRLMSLKARLSLLEEGANVRLLKFIYTVLSEPEGSNVPPGTEFKATLDVTIVVNRSGPKRVGAGKNFRFHEDTGKSETSLLAIWGLPEDWKNGAGYDLHIRDAGEEGDTDLFFDIPDIHTLHKQVVSLCPGTEYVGELITKAKDGYRDSEPVTARGTTDGSSRAALQSPAVPTFTRITQTADEVSRGLHRISTAWVDPNNSYLVQGYKVRFQRRGDAAWTVVDARLSSPWTGFTAAIGEEEWCEGGVWLVSVKALASAQAGAACAHSPWSDPGELTLPRANPTQSLDYTLFVVGGIDQIWDHGCRFGCSLTQRGSLSLFDNEHFARKMRFEFMPVTAEVDTVYLDMDVSPPTAWPLVIHALPSTLAAGTEYRCGVRALSNDLCKMNHSAWDYGRISPRPAMSA